MDAAAAEITRSNVGLSAIKNFRQNAATAAGALAVFVIVILAAASIVTTRTIADSLARYRALTAASDATASVVEDQLNEETGIRGYAATGDRVFLQPYNLAGPKMARDYALLRADLHAASSSDLLPAAARLEALNATWQRDVARPTLSAHDPRNTGYELRGKQLVDRYRAVAAAINRRLSLSLRELSGELTERLRTIAFMSTLLVVLAGAIVASITTARAAARRQIAIENERRLAMEKAASQMRALIEAIPNIVWITDRNGSVTYFSERWYTYTGRPQGSGDIVDLIGALHPEDRARAEEAWHEAVRTGKAHEIQYRLRASDGSYKWFVARGVPERDAAGEIVQWFGTCTDINDQHLELENIQRVADAFARAQLPATLPVSPYARFDATYVAAEDISQIGGDWYDIFEAANNRFVFSLGDVTGHGLDAAIVMTRVRQAIIALASVDNDPAVILEKANRVLRMQGETMVTALCGIFDAQAGGLVYASAGHPPSLIRRSNGTLEDLTSTAPPLGILDRLRVDRRQAQLAPGDMLVCYTDGMIENERDPIQGEERLRAALMQLTPFERPHSAAALRERILGSARGRDDVAILVVERSGPGLAASEAEDRRFAAGS